MNALDGLKIIDLTRYVAGPHCTMLLSELGAEVIKIERCDGGDELRNIGPQIHNTSLWSAVLNRSKKSLSLNIKKTKGKSILLDLIKQADVLVENFRPGIMEKLGLDWKTLSQINKKLILARISGYGQLSYNQDRQAFDATVQAETGFMKISGKKNSNPIMIGTVLLDYTTGLNMTIGILSALYKRTISKKGELVECSLSDAAMSLSMNAVPDFYENKNDFAQAENRDRFSMPSNTYLTKNGHVHIMAGSNDRFYKLLKAMNNIKLFKNKKYNTLINRISNIDELDKIISNWTKKHTTKKIGIYLSKVGVPWGEVKSMGGFLKSKVGKESVVKAEIKNKTIYVPKLPIKFPLHNNVLDRKVPLLGEDNDYVLKKYLGLTNSQISKLEEEEVITKKTIKF